MLKPLDPDLRYVTNGELREFSRCRRRWWLRSYRRLGSAREKVTGPAPLGTRVHAALAAYYAPGELSRNPLDVLEELADRDRQVLAEREADAADRKALEADVDLAQLMVEGYLEWVTEEAADAGLRVIAPEARVVADPKLEDHPYVRLLAKLDVRAVQERDGSRVFIDHKTVGDFTRSTSILHMDEQMMQYHLVEILAGLDDPDAARTDGALYNMLRKVKRTARAKPPFYKRIEVRHAPETLRSYYRRTVGKIREILRVTAALDAGAHHLDVAWPTPTKDCSWDCEFYPICPMFDDGSRVEDFLATAYVEVDPLRRYAPESSGVTE